MQWSKLAAPALGLLGGVAASMGARLVLELARRGGIVGAVVALDPGGFWQGWEVPYFYYSVLASQKLVGVLQPVLPALTGNAVGRTVLLPQFSARPWALPAHQALDELRTLGTTPGFAELLDELAHGEEQQGAAPGSIVAPLVIGWGRHDRVCLPAQAAVAQARFPDARLYWFEHCGHFPQWDQPAEAARLILAAVSGDAFVDATLAPANEASPAPASTARQVLVLSAGLALLASGLALLFAYQRPRARV